jgi:very-short-patch-repair endonuclease
MEEPPYRQSSRKFARGNRHAMTKAETMVWWAIRDHKLGVQFRRQMPIGPYTADFAAHAFRLIVEIDGRTHETEEARLRDKERQVWLEQQGWRVLRFSDAAVIGGLDLVVAEMRRVCTSRVAATGHTPSVTTSS